MRNDRNSPLFLQRGATRLAGGRGRRWDLTLSYVDFTLGMFKESIIHIFTLLKRGFIRSCPQCGTSGLFKGYLKIAQECPSCGLDFDSIRSDDAPAYFTIAIVGHLILPLISIVEFSYHPDYWLHLLLWPPLTIALTLYLLPRVKGMVMAMLWKLK